ncbi:glutamine synthetase family protein [Reinekea marinisedimentorum]|uniref:Glutamine synthetase n=1 Tax=Reinekea marinisedimentorum TaxID=230495 RepID=A0A4R3I682_9GAMM|nr:glutamine synthetase family protein [Reinekea marinisedimentorum]TCS40662.1 glutamine synthetase [Reinekea marinisedimentorum]
MPINQSAWLTAEHLPEVKQFIDQHPEIESVDLILFDTNGKERGKRIPVSLLPKVVEQGVCLPASVFALDIQGETIEETGLGFDQGDSDRQCRLVPNTLSVIPWKPGVAQAMLTMLCAEREVGFFADARQVLRRQLLAMKARGYQPCVAVEYEFYLQDLEPDEQGMPQPPIMPLSKKRMSETQVYSLDELDEFKDFIDEVIAVCEAQNIPAANITAEYAPGQFEVNLKHSTDVLLACDQSLLMKRAIRAVAKQHGFTANFMAKPYSEYAGSGCHIHISLLDEEGDNLFIKKPEILHHSVAGVLETMPQSMAVLAPNANSYRRFQPNKFVALWPNWGWDNRTVALRIPSDSEENRRLEHRLAGADCNPYLVVAVILASMQEGMDKQLNPPEPITGNAYEMAGENHFPLSWPEALEAFRSCEVLYRHLTPEYCHVYLENKYSEQLTFAAQVSPLEYQWYL